MFCLKRSVKRLPIEYHQTYLMFCLKRAHRIPPDKPDYSLLDGSRLPEYNIPPEYVLKKGTVQKNHCKKFLDMISHLDPRIRSTLVFAFHKLIEEKGINVPYTIKLEHLEHGLDANSIDIFSRTNFWTYEDGELMQEKENLQKQLKARQEADKLEDLRRRLLAEAPAKYEVFSPCH